MRLRFIAALAGLLCAGAIAGGVALGEGGDAPGTAPSVSAEAAMDMLAGLTGQTRPDDLVYARRLVMTMIGSRANLVSLMGMPGAEYHGDLAQEALLTMGFLFNVFPHLFAPETDTMPVEDEPGNLHITNARPEIWEDFDAFYDRSIAAGDLAFAALNARPGEAFENAVVDLQAACDSCHADYRRERSTYGIPIPPLD